MLHIALDFLYFLCMYVHMHIKKGITSKELFYILAMKSEGDIQNETFTTLSNAIRTGQNIKAENIDELLEKHQDSISLMKNALKQTISHDITSLAVCQLLDNTSEVNYMDEAISSLMQCNDKKQVSLCIYNIVLDYNFSNE